MMQTTQTHAHCGSGAAAGAGEQASEFLTFTLGHEEYGIDILKVQEIRGYDAVDPHRQRARPSSRAWSTCAASSCPIVDMRIKFNLGERRPTTSSRW